MLGPHNAAPRVLIFVFSVSERLFCLASFFSAFLQMNSQSSPGPTLQVFVAERLTLFESRGFLRNFHGFSDDWKKGTLRHSRSCFTRGEPAFQRSPFLPEEVSKLSFPPPHYFPPVTDYQESFSLFPTHLGCLGLNPSVPPPSYYPPSSPGDSSCSFLGTSPLRPSPQ